MRPASAGVCPRKIGVETLPELLNIARLGAETRVNGGAEHVLSFE